jgi:hypothetical protein
VGSFGEGLATFQKNRTIWETRRATPTPVAAAALGARVTVLGVVDGETLLRAPITHANVVAYIARIEELVRIPGDDKPLSRPIAAEEKHVAFLVVDDEGRSIRVEDGPATLGDPPVDTGDRAVRRGNRELEALARKGGVKGSLPDELVLLEHRLAPGDRVRVTGIVGEGANVVATGYRDAAGKMKTLTGTDDAPLIIVKA